MRVMDACTSERGAGIDTDAELPTWGLLDPSDRRERGRQRWRASLAPGMGRRVEAALAYCGIAIN